MPTDDLLLVGRVARAHGNRGQVIVNPETDFAEDRFQVGRVLLVGTASETRRISAVRFHQGRPVIALEGVNTMDDAEALAGAELKIAQHDLEPLPERTFYRHDLVGSEVLDTGDHVIGTVTAVEGPLDRSQLVVEGRHGEILVPLVEGICVQVDPALKRIVVNPPEGLLELNETQAGRSAAERRAASTDERRS
jgi:16S rRNA processing protein RimM